MTQPSVMGRAAERANLIDLARAVRAMVKNGHPCSTVGDTSGDEWFEVMCRRLAPLEVFLDSLDDG